jgi:hypothetical protein
MGILLDSFWMLNHDMDAGGKKDAVLLALTVLASKVGAKLASYYVLHLDRWKTRHACRKNPLPKHCTTILLKGEFHEEKN